MKNINELKEGIPVIFSALQHTFTVKEFTETGNVIIFIEGTNIERETDIKNIYPITEHVLKVSKFARETRDAVKKLIPFGVSINDRLMKKSFLMYWIEMCEAEGNEKAFEKAKVKFNLFIAALTSSLEALDCLKVIGIPLLSPMIPDQDQEN